MPWDHTLHTLCTTGVPFASSIDGVRVGHGVPATPRRFPGNLALGSQGKPAPVDLTAENGVPTNYSGVWPATPLVGAWYLLGQHTYIHTIQ